MLNIKLDPFRILINVFLSSSYWSLMPFLFFLWLLRMVMASQVQSQLSKDDVVAIGGNLAANQSSGGGIGTAILRRQLSPVSSIEFVASTGLQSLIGMQTTR